MRTPDAPPYARLRPTSRGALILAVALGVGCATEERTVRGVSEFCVEEVSGATEITATLNNGFVHDGQGLSLQIRRGEEQFEFQLVAAGFSS